MFFSLLQNIDFSKSSKKMHNFLLVNKQEKKMGVYEFDFLSARVFLTLPPYLEADFLTFCLQ